MVGIKYIGKRETHVDNLYGTNLEWKPGQTHNVDDAVAARMLPHADVYEVVKPKQGEKAAEVEVKADANEIIPLPNLDGMGKHELQHFAQQHYGENLHPNMSEANMRAKVMNLIQSRGR